ncbi:hypothetical protein LTR02_014571 [Friedmanniomyces endolithicus]|nr:hypothetical protein LTR03_008699 [Friedmanniomyces endolithicus]KAK0890627.1 hypothetical protein LTR02_014571 [Friedmanniomyces endolithicus]
MAPPLPGYSSHFGLDNIPFGIASSDLHPNPACATRFKDSVMFLDKLDDMLKGIQNLPEKVLAHSTLNAFAALPNATHRAVRERLQSLIRKDEQLHSLPAGTVEPISAVIMHLPVDTGDFTDMSCSMDHAQNASEAMTGKRSLPPALLHMPIGYAGRCSSLDVSGTPVERPLDGLRAGACRNHWQATTEEATLTASQAEAHIFGYVLLNDWSARDIQGFEMVPLGPLNGKNAGTTLSPWVVTTDALNAYHTASPPRAQKVMPYLADSGNDALDIKLEVRLSSPKSTAESEFACRSNSSWIYWTLAQCVAHQAVGGCGLRTGDLIATGTVSGAESNEHGGLMEYMKQGKRPPRGYLEDGETVTLSGYCGDGVGFGECVATLTPARELET